MRLSLMERRLDDTPSFPWPHGKGPPPKLAALSQEGKQSPGAYLPHLPSSHFSFPTAVCERLSQPLGSVRVRLFFVQVDANPGFCSFGCFVYIVRMVSHLCYPGCISSVKFHQPWLTVSNCRFVALPSTVDMLHTQPLRLLELGPSSSHLRARTP